MGYRTSNHAIHNLNYHIVFCPKRRKSVLVGQIAIDLEAIIRDKLAVVKVKIESLAIQPDHVHLFVSCPPTISPHKIVKLIKGGSARILRTEFPQLKKLPTLWTRSYYVGSVGHVSESVVKSYIENQKGK